MKDIYLYVGPHRSGSVFLQTYILPHVPGVYTAFSRDPKLNDMVFTAMDDHPMFMDVEKVRRDIHKRLEGVQENKIIISDAEFFGDYGKRNADGAYISKPFYDNAQRTELLSRLFDRPKIILTPRRQDLWIESAYMHFIKNFYTFSFDEFLSVRPGLANENLEWRSLKPRCDPTVLDWGVYVRNYQQVFGAENVLVLPHEMMLHELPEFLRRLYEFMETESYYPESIPHENKSLTRTGYRFAMMINRFVHTPRNRAGFIPISPFWRTLARMRARKDNKILWALAGISRRINTYWFLSEVIGKYERRKPNLLCAERRNEILDYYRDRNRAYAELIGIDLGKYGYY